MINVYIKVIEGGVLQREHISAWIYKNFSKTYHDEGLSKYFNGSSVKAHSFYFSYNKKLKKGDIECIQIMGIEPIENKILSMLDIGKEVNLGKVKGEIYFVEYEDYKKKSFYKIKSPLIMRYSKQSKEVEGLEESYYQTITPSMNSDEWNRVIKESLIRRAVSLYDYVIEDELRDIDIIHEIDVRAQLNIKGKKMVYKAVMGTLRVDADEFWHEFIQRVGLGNRNTYGFGIIG